MEGVTWKVINEHTDFTPEGDRNRNSLSHFTFFHVFPLTLFLAAKPWDSDRITRRVVRWGTRGVDIAPILIDHPDKYKPAVFNDSVHFHLLWDEAHPDVLANIREGFNSYKDQKTD